MDDIVITQTSPFGVGSHTNTIWLPAQTTPFTPYENTDPDRNTTKKWCEPSAHCDQVWSRCVPQYFENYSFTTTVENTRTECFPTGFYDIAEDMSAAYPGTACISGWHSACATTFGYLGQTYSQVWCCPAGEYECVGTDAYLSATVRQCASSVLNPSQYGLTFGLWDTNIGDYSSKTVTTKVFPTVPAGQGWQYRIDAMPLQIPPKTTSLLPPLTTEPGSVTVYLSPEETSASAAGGTPHHLPKGSIAGIICGSTAAALILAAMFFVCARRRRRRNQQGPETAVVGQGVDSYYGKPELPTVDAVRAEMDGHAVYHEMDGKSLPAEALSPHTIPDEQAGTGVETEAKPSDGGVQELPGVAMGS